MPSLWIHYDGSVPGSCSMIEESAGRARAAASTSRKAIEKLTTAEAAEARNWASASSTVSKVQGLTRPRAQQGLNAPGQGTVMLYMQILYFPRLCVSVSSKLPDIHVFAQRDLLLSRTK